MISVYVKIESEDLPRFEEPPIQTKVQTEVGSLIAENREAFLDLCSQAWDRYEAMAAGREVGQ